MFQVEIVKRKNKFYVQGQRQLQVESGKIENNRS